VSGDHFRLFTDHRNLHLLLFLSFLCEGGTRDFKLSGRKLLRRKEIKEEYDDETTIETYKSEEKPSSVSVAVSAVIGGIIKTLKELLSNETTTEFLSWSLALLVAMTLMITKDSCCVLTATTGSKLLTLSRVHCKRARPGISALSPTDVLPFLSSGSPGRRLMLKARSVYRRLGLCERDSCKEQASTITRHLHLLPSSLRFYC